MFQSAYRLKIEWANLETYFTRVEDEIITEWFSHRNLQRFLNSVEYPFSFNDVEFNPDYYTSIDGFGSDINAVIINYHLKYISQNCNFLAFDKFSDKQIFLRTNDLMLFPKYFENWIVYEIYYNSTPHHIIEYYSIKKELDYVINHSQYFKYLPLSDMMYISLCLDAVNHDNCRTELIQSVLVGFERIFKNKKTFFEIKNAILTKPNWMRFCKSVRSSFLHSELDHVFQVDNSIGNDFSLRNMNSIEVVIAANQDLNKKLKHAQFFEEFLRTDNTELTLLKTIPVSLTNKNSTLLIN
jgi:hypothetical protein